MKSFVARIPIIGRLLQRTYWLIVRKFEGQADFQSSQDYWKRRYDVGGNSGAGSYGKFAEFKASYLNEFVLVHGISSVMEFGCGDGNQLKLAKYPSYIGFDVSDSAVKRCQELFFNDGSKSFRLMNEYRDETVELSLSLDVIYHLVEDDAFEEYMITLFSSAIRFVIIYSSNYDRAASKDAPHVRHRQFNRWVESKISGWKLIQHRPNIYPASEDGQGTFADFYVFENIRTDLALKDAT